MPAFVKRGLRDPRNKLAERLGKAGYPTNLLDLCRMIIAPASYYWCPCCGQHFPAFEPFPYWEKPERYNVERYLNADNYVVCPKCKSSPRHRMLVYWMQHHLEELEGKQILHFAQEPCVKRWLEKQGIANVSADLYNKKADLQIDIEDTGFVDASASVVICNHVLEHVNDYKQALRELHRILADDGLLLLTVPIDLSYEETHEDPSVVSSYGRKIAFGQVDHLRAFGRNAKEEFGRFGFDIEIVEGDSMPQKIKPVVGASDYNINWLFIMRKAR